MNKLAFPKRELSCIQIILWLAHWNRFPPMKTWHCHECSFFAVFFYLNVSLAAAASNHGFSLPFLLCGSCGWQDPGRTIVHPRATRDMFIVPWVCLTGVTWWSRLYTGYTWNPPKAFRTFEGLSKTLHTQYTLKVTLSCGTALSYTIKISSHFGTGTLIDNLDSTGWHESMLQPK